MFHQLIVAAEDDLELIPAIDVAVKKMKLNEHSLFRIKPKYGFGAKGSEKHSIPPNADLVYELKLLSFEKAKESWEMTDEEKLEQSEIVKAKGTEQFKVSGEFFFFLMKSECNAGFQIRWFLVVLSKLYGDRDVISSFRCWRTNYVAFPPRFFRWSNDFF